LNGRDAFFEGSIGGIGFAGCAFKKKNNKSPRRRALPVAKGLHHGQKPEIFQYTAGYHLSFFIKYRETYLSIELPYAIEFMDFTLTKRK
jgi:hypothetical protein